MNDLVSWLASSVRRRRRSYLTFQHKLQLMLHSLSQEDWILGWGGVQELGSAYEERNKRPHETRTVLTENILRAEMHMQGKPNIMTEIYSLAGSRREILLVWY
jgi:hypothetical protein